MLRENRRLFEALFMAADLSVVTCAWLLTFWLRFHSGLLAVRSVVPPYSDYLILLPLVWVIWVVVLKAGRLHRPMRGFGK